EDRETVAAEAKTQLNESYKKGLLSTLNRTAAAEQAYRGQQDAEALRAEKRALTDQFKMLTVATEQADRLVGSSRRVRPRTVTRAHYRYHQRRLGPPWCCGARRRFAVGTGGRSPICGRLGSGRQVVQIGRGPTSIDRCRSRRLAGHDFKDRPRGVG